MFSTSFKKRRERYGEKKRNARKPVRCRKKYDFDSTHQSVFGSTVKKKISPYATMRRENLMSKVFFFQASRKSVMPTERKKVTIRLSIARIIRIESLPLFTM